MKFELGPELVHLVKETLKEMGVEDTIDNRRKFVKLAFDTGLSQLFFCAGLSCRFEDEFPNSSITRVGPYNEDDEDEPKPEPPKPEHAPDPCKLCGKTPKYNGKSQWACNCQLYDVGPKPISPCPYCHVELKPNHYYWECLCNRYDEAPEPAKPVVWSNSFPE